MAFHENVNMTGLAFDKEVVKGNGKNSKNDAKQGVVQTQDYSAI